MRCEFYTLYRALYRTLRDSLIPLMVTRLILSLRKAANPQDSIWSRGTGQVDTVRFARDAVSGTEGGGGDIALGHLSSGGSSGLP